jgi:hypothetical protein
MSPSAVPAITTTSSPVSQQLDALIARESTFADSPPSYPGSEMQVKIPITPQAAHLPKPSPLCDDMLPDYEHVKVDMPPSYPVKKVDDEFFNPIQPQTPWPLTKKFYVFGFVFWPLWFLGAGFSIFGKKPETRRWGRRCLWNALVVAIIFTYVLVAYFRTGGQLM